MAHDPLDHISDSFYFQVPPEMWRYASDETIYQQVPAWVWDTTGPAGVPDGKPDHSPQELKSALDGKIIIPQPFGVPKNLYEPGTGFCISRLMIVMFVVAVLIAVAFIWLANRLKGGQAPRGPLTNLLEVLVGFIRNTVAKPILHENADAYAPFLLTLFFFILGLNLAGLVPFLGTATALLSVTLALAGLTFVIVVVVGMWRHGVAGFWLGLMPHIKLPAPLVPLLGLIFLIEVGSFLIKHAVLSVRLVANIGGGHLVLAGLESIPALALQHGSFMYAFASVLVAVGAMLFSLLELLVAFIQAYVFTLLSALFINAAIHQH